MKCKCMGGGADLEMREISLEEMIELNVLLKLSFLFL